MLFEAFAAAFLLIALTEMGDKTQLVAVSLSSRHDHRTVFAAVFLALVAVTALGVAFGTVIFSYVPILWIRLAAAAIFFGFGIWTLRGDEDDDDAKANGNSGGADVAGDGPGNRSVFARAFAITSAAEMGDKTQLSAIALTASFGAPLEVLAGAAAGFALVTGLGVWVGKKLGEKLDEGLLRKAGGALFLVIGVFMLADVFL